MDIEQCNRQIFEINQGKMAELTEISYQREQESKRNQSKVFLNRNQKIVQNQESQEEENHKDQCNKLKDYCFQFDLKQQNLRQTHDGMMKQQRERSQFSEQQILSKSDQAVSIQKRLRRREKMLNAMKNQQTFQNEIVQKQWIQSGQNLKNCHLKKNQQKQIKQVEKSHSIKCLVHKDNKGFNMIWPQFHLSLFKNNRYIMSAKKTSSKPYSTYIISSDPSVYDEDSKFYLGKIKSNLLGNKLHIFDKGMNPTNAFQYSKVPREMLASISFKKYSQDGLDIQEIQIFSKKAEYRYYCSFPQISMYQAEMGLDKLYEYPQNKHKINHFKSRRPVWSTANKSYELYFKDNPIKTHQKNFILEDSDSQMNILQFGNIQKEDYYLQIQNKLSIFIAFALSVSNLSTRFIL